MGARLHTLALGAAWLAGAAGCLLTTSLDGLDDAAGDAGPRADGLAPGEGGSTGGGGTGDARVEADAASADFRCNQLSPAPLFCTDFDDGTLDSIIDTHTMLGGAVALDDAVFRSASRSVKLTVPAVTSGSGFGRASLSRVFGFAPQTAIRVAFDLKVNSADSSSANTVSLSMGGYELALFLGASAAKVRQGIPGDAGVAFSATDVVPPSKATWVHVSFSIVLAKDASTATVAYDGVPQSALPIVMDRYRANTWSAGVGVLYTEAPDDGRELHIDDLVIDAK